MPIECVIYARVSTKDQEREGFSIPAQLELLKAYAVKNNFKIVAEYTESETAGKAGRMQFNAMAKVLQQKKGPKIVLVEKTDRLTRNFQNYVLIEKLALEHGVEFHLVKENEIISKNATGHTKLVQGLKVLLAKNYIDNLREETKKGILQKLKQGGWAWQAPIGYKMVKGELVIDVEKAPFVKKAFELYGDGNQSIESLRDALVDAGYFYRDSSPKVPKTQLYNILTNPIYGGEVHYQGVAYKGRHEPLVSAQLWAAVQKIMSKGRFSANKKYNFLYQYALSCGECGSPMCGEEKRGGRYIYYRCWKSANGDCKEGYTNERDITAQLDSIFSKLVLPIDYKVSMKKAYYELKGAKQNTEADETDRINKERQRIKSKIERAYEDKLEGMISNDLWKMASEKLEAQLLALDDAQARISKAELPFFDLFDQFLELPEMLSNTWISGDQEEKGDLVKIVTSNISIKAKKVTVELVQPFDYFYKEMGLSGKYPQGNSKRRSRVYRPLPAPPET